MKAAKFIPILLFTLAFYGCKKSDQAPKVTNLLTYTYQGTKYTLPTPYLVTVQHTTDLSVNGAVQGGANLSIYINNYQQGSSFPVGNQSFVDFNIPNSLAAYSCNGGTIVISSLTQTHVKGTFSATSFHISDPSAPGIPVTGTFDVDIQQ